MTVATELRHRHPPLRRQSGGRRPHPRRKSKTRASFFFWYKPEMRNLLHQTLAKLGLKSIATRLFDEPQKTTDVAPPPHITPRGQGQNKIVRRDHDQDKSPAPPRGPGFFRRRDRRK
jgi:hypothetical protein